MRKISFKKLSLLLAVCFAVGLLFAVAPAGAAKVPDKLVIGTHLPLTGGLASVGQEQKWAYETAVADINATGGVFYKPAGKKIPIELVVFDDESDPAKAATAVERLIRQRKVDCILSGHAAAYGVITGCITAEKYKQYYHGTACFIPLWQERNFQWSTMVFFDLVENCSIPYELWNSFPEDQRPKNPAIFMEDTFDARGLASVLREQAPKYGYELKVDISWTPGAKDFSTQIIRAKEAGVDAILVFGDVADCVTLTRQMKANDWAPKYFQGWRGTWPAEFWDAVGDNGQYVLTDGHWARTYPTEGSEELGARFYEKFGKDSVSVGAFYGVAQILFQALEKVDSLDPKHIRETVIANEYDTVLGHIKYNADGSATYPSPAFQWMDGVQLTVWPKDLAVAEMVWAIPWRDRAK